MIQIGFNAQYLLGFLSRRPAAAKWKLEFKDSQSAGQMRPAEGEDYKYRYSRNADAHLTMEDGRPRPSGLLLAISLNLPPPNVARRSFSITQRLTRGAFIRRKVAATRAEGFSPMLSGFKQFILSWQCNRYGGRRP